MKKSLLIALAAVAAMSCQQDNKAIEKKLDQIIAKLDKMGPGGGNQQQRPQRPEPDRSKTYAVPIDGDSFDGPADAAVTIVKAIDYA